MTQMDIYGRTSKLEKSVLGAIAIRLEARRADGRYMSMLHEYLDLVKLAEKKNVLALGCGTGVEVRELLLRDDFTGDITAVDISSELVEYGKTLFAEEKIGDNVNWVTADASSTGLRIGCYDLIISHTLISHVPNPRRVLTEIARLLTPNGTVVIFDGDYATMTYGTDNAEYGKEMDEKIIQSMVANPRVMRSMPRMLSSAGFSLENSKSWVLTEIGKASFFSGSLDSLPKLLPDSGLVTQAEADSFVADQRKASEDGTFFAGYNFYAMIAKFKDGGCK